MARPSVKREELKNEIDKNKILELFVCEYSADAIAEKLGCSEVYVEQVLNASLAGFYRKNQEYAERAALMHIAKTRALTKKWMPIALDGNLSAAQFILKVINTERDIIQDGIQKEKETSTAEEIQKFEQTLTSTDPRYAIALENLTEDWMGRNVLDVEALIGTVPEMRAEATSNLSELHKAYTNLEESLDALNTDSDL